MIKVAIFMGSASDEELMRPCADILDSMEINHRFTITSAHRTPERTEKLIRELEAEGCEVFICGAGMAAHLAGAVAARTLKPVIGVPLTASSLGGMDALLSTVQMPQGFPVATMALDRSGARNAAWLATQILALKDEAIAARLRDVRDGFKEAVDEAAFNLENGAI
ncbi:5-(carboxyamino)imidazole ribonucleotide mutase [Oceanidesulfovibrio marinus]|uniref:N5-carboxyaminoimidazole ribonucleotide mutase n=1 Tax=Oceanidesulfovibrio marinus TaxID=370038 RepID=A0A6P1ZMR9_9BACT|nr:5-(carboxyamino)imidazole ribonucleotide mutase [Oceanidesulfovibrio marinus]TVM35715.1 5-(carboxyamino)imidazole ribonucleotide mutase [Oceanidesulfovibrio marinus]